jgi:hypothetical protein
LNELVGTQIFIDQSEALITGEGLELPRCNACITNLGNWLTGFNDPLQDNAGNNCDDDDNYNSYGSNQDPHPLPSFAIKAGKLFPGQVSLLFTICHISFSTRTGPGWCFGQGL